MPQTGAFLRGRRYRHSLRDGSKLEKCVSHWPSVRDEAFPEITIDLVSLLCHRPIRDYVDHTSVLLQVLVRAVLTAETLAALAHRLQIPPSLMFMSCPGANFTHYIVDLGTRLISL